MFCEIFTKNHWVKNRKAYMIAARECRAALMNPEGYHRYAQGDERLDRAVGQWVSRARAAHSIAMGRRPLIPHALVIDGAQAAVGSLNAA